MRVIHLKDFVTTGKFDQIEVGKSTKEDVIALMGDDYDFADCDDTQIIKYGWYEFFYWTESEIIFGIQNDHLQYDCGNHDEMINYENDRIKIDNWFLEVNKDATFSEVIKIIENEGVDYELDKQKFEGALEYVKLENGVTIDFSDELVSWVYDKKEDEWDMKIDPIKIQGDYVLIGIRFFKF